MSEVSEGSGIDAAAVEDQPTDLSREWLGASADEEPFCARPWRLLKVTLAGRTKVCCDFAVALPEFEWPTAKDFHSPDGMWNHPFLQHLRRTMGGPDEVPFCTLCLTKDKRSPEHAELRARARQETVDLYRELDDVAHARRFRGTVAEHEPLAELEVRLDSGAAARPFVRGAAHYRRLVRTVGLAGRGRVLQVGVSAPMSPFLAEANDELTVVAPPAMAARAVALCRVFDLEPRAAVLAPDLALPVEDAAYDAVWIDGPTLHRSDRTRLLAEVRRVLRPEGTIHVRRAPGPGAADVGTAHDGVGSVVTLKALRGILHRNGLRLDARIKITTTWSRRPGAEEPVEETVSFSATARPAAATTDLGMPTVRS